MKFQFTRIRCVILAATMLVVATGCSTTPRSKPLTEMTEAEQIAYNQHAPMEKPAEPGIGFGDVVKTIGAVIVFVPVLVWESLAWGGAQISTGK